jgi:hypothetical protein
MVKVTVSTPKPTQAISREDLLNRANHYEIQTFADGTYDYIEASQNGQVIHTSKANYESSPNPLTGVPDLKSVDGYLFPEIFNAYLVEQTTAENAELITSNANLNANQITSKISKSTTGAVSLIQTAGGQSTSSSGLTASFAVAPTPGNIIMLAVASVGAAVLVQTISEVGVIWTQLKKKQIAGGFMNIEIWQGVVGAGASPTVNIVLTGIPHVAELDECEFAINGGVLDQSAVNNGSSASPDTGTTAATTQANELLFGATVDLANVSGTPAQTNPTNGFKLIDGIGYVYNMSLAVLWMNQTVIGAADCTTTSITNNFWVGAIVTLTAN